MISLIVPCYNEILYIDCFVKNIEKIFRITPGCELIIIDGGSTDGTLLRLNEFAKFFNFTLLINNSNIVPISLNMGISVAKYDYIARLDVHSIYPSCYLDVLYNATQQFECGNVGFRINTLPGSNTKIAHSIAYCMSSVFGVGSSKFRINGSGYSFVDTVPFGFFKKSLLVEIGGYDPIMIKNEDDELNLRIIKAGKKIVLVSDHCINYYARPDLYKYIKMMFQYGFYKPLLYKKNGKISSFRQLLPPFFVVFFIFSFFISFLTFMPLALLFALYVSFVFIGYYKSPRSFSVLILFVSMFSTHFFYGLGYILGVIDIFSGGKIRKLNFLSASTR